MSAAADADDSAAFASATLYSRTCAGLQGGTCDASSGPLAIARSRWATRWEVYALVGIAAHLTLAGGAIAISVLAAGSDAIEAVVPPALSAILGVAVALSTVSRAYIYSIATIGAEVLLVTLACALITCIVSAVGGGLVAACVVCIGLSAFEVFFYHLSVEQFLPSMRDPHDPAATPRYARETPIVIVGAGISGLTAAHELAALGYTNVTVLERNQWVGGKASSVHEPGSGLIFERGTAWFSPSAVYRRLMREYAVGTESLTPRPPIKYVLRNADGTYQNLGNPWLMSIPGGSRGARFGLGVGRLLEVCRFVRFLRAHDYCVRTRPGQVDARLEEASHCRPLAEYLTAHGFGFYAQVYGLRFHRWKPLRRSPSAPRHALSPPGFFL